MEIRISSPRHYEIYHGSSQLVRAYLDQIEKTAGEILVSEAIDRLRISPLIATAEELAQGKFLAFEQFDWSYKIVAIGVNGDFQRYHRGDDPEKISALSEMLQTAFEKVGRKRKARFNSALANEIVRQITQAFLEKQVKQ